VRHSTPHTPHSHGDVERQNRIINDLLRTSFERYPDIRPKWETYAKILQFTMNSQVVERHGMTPLFFFYGRHPRMPSSLSLPTVVMDPLSLEFVESFSTRLQQALDVGRECQVRMAEALDAKRDARYAYQVGGWAFLASSETPVPGENHFQCKWQGPFPITATSTSTVTLDLPEHWQSRSNTFHVDKVRPYVLREGASLPPIRPRAFRIPRAFRPASQCGCISRITHHRRNGRLSDNGLHMNLQYLVH